MKVGTVHRITGLHLILNDTGAAAWFDLEPGDDWSVLGPPILKRIQKACVHGGFGEIPVAEHHFEGGLAKRKSIICQGKNKSLRERK